MNLNDETVEIKLEEIRVYLEKTFHNAHFTRESALNFIVEDFYANYYGQIKKANE